MIPAEDFCDELERRGFTVASGVPCSHFGGPIELLSRTPGRYVPAANEGGALAIAAGFALAGRKPYVMLQNSGLGNLVNPLTSLVMTYGIPVLSFVSLRGYPDPGSDEPQHEVMGQVSHPLLDLLGLPNRTLRAGDGVAELRALLARADQELDAGRAPFVLVERGAVGKARPAGGEPAPEGLASAEVARIVVDLCADHPVIATTGYTARELFAVGDRPQNFYMQGSMGHASSLALGVALADPSRPVIVLDGDGAALMHLGAFSVIGHEAPANLVHLILDNGLHESTGGQRTTSRTTSFAAVAKGAGYRSAVRCRTPEEVTDAMSRALSCAGPHLCVVRTRPRTGAVPPRATSALSARQIKERFEREIRARGPVPT
ncbi:phosphonopyruvate decarboxylase [Streptomyces capparidis]